MDDLVAQRYRDLVARGFPNAGSLESPSMFIDSKAEGVSICGQGGQDYMNIYIRISNDIITDAKYLCTCDPTANVVVEALCQLVKGLTVRQAKSLSKEQFFEVLGTDGGTVRRKVWGAVELITRVIGRWEAQNHSATKVLGPG